MTVFESSLASRELIETTEQEPVKRLDVDVDVDPSLLSPDDRKSLRRAMERLRKSIRIWEAEAAAAAAAEPAEAAGAAGQNRLAEDRHIDR
jgi:hypothetical protein